MNSIFEEHGGTYTLRADGMLYMILWRNLA